MSLNNLCLLFISKINNRNTQNYTKFINRTKLSDHFSAFCFKRHKIEKYKDEKYKTIFIVKL